MFNASADYVLGNFRGRLSYRYRSEYLEGIDTTKYLDDWFACANSSTPRSATACEKTSSSP